MKGKEIIKVLESNYRGIDTLRYRKRYENGDNRIKNIHWLMDNFACSYGVGARLVDRANNYPDWN